MLFEKLTLIFSDNQEIEIYQSDVRQAVAALLIHASRIDGHIDPAELAARDRLLRQKFDLADAEIAELVLEAETAEKEAIDLYQFTRTIKQNYDRDKRARVVEMLWEIALADGVIDAHEANLVWRVAGLLGFDSRENVSFRQNVQARLSRAASKPLDQG